MRFRPVVISLPCLVVVFLASRASGQEAASPLIFKTAHNIQYRSESRAPDQPSADEATRCCLDLQYPSDDNAAGFATVVWFHGGGLTQGVKEIPQPLMQQPFAVAGVGYRLSPTVRGHDCIADAAAAVAWVLRSISDYGGDPDKVYVSGHSAGGYLASMVGIDERWLAAEGLDFRTLAGVIPYSGQVITHFTIRGERGIPDTRPIIDEYAPLYHVRKDAPPFLLITGDRAQEMLGRYEENAYFWRMLKVAGHTDVELIEMKGTDHAGMVTAGHERLCKYLSERNDPK